MSRKDLEFLKHVKVSTSGIEKETCKMSLELKFGVKLRRALCVKLLRPWTRSKHAMCESKV